MEDHGRELRDPRSIFEENPCATHPRTVKYIMLKTGRIELFAQVEDHPSSKTGTHIRLYEPLQIFSSMEPGVMPGAEAQTQAIVLHEWIPFLDVDYVDVPRDSILIHSSIRPEMTQFYTIIAKKFRLFNASIPVFVAPPKGLMDLAALDPTKGDFLDKFQTIMDTMDEESKSRLREGTATILNAAGDTETAEETLKKGDDVLAEIAAAMAGKKGETIH